jgi:hypothetical protein
LIWIARRGFGWLRWNRRLRRGRVQIGVARGCAQGYGTKNRRYQILIATMGVLRSS